jgi:hypothetical protein
LFERTAQKEKNSSKIITQDIRRRKNLPFLDIIPTAPEKTQVQREKEGAFIRNGRENQSRRTKKTRRLDLPRSTLPRISCRRQEGGGFSEGGFSPAVILSGAKDLALEEPGGNNEILRAVMHTLRMTSKSSHSERSDRAASPQGTKDLGFEWGHDQKRDPSGGETYPQEDTKPLSSLTE